MGTSRPRRFASIHEDIEQFVFFGMALEKIDTPVVVRGWS